MEGYIEPCFSLKSLSDISHSFYVRVSKLCSFFHPGTWKYFTSNRIRCDSASWLKASLSKVLTCLICKHFTRQECRGYTWARTQTCLLWSSIYFGPRQLALSYTAPARSWGDSIGQRPFPAKLTCMHENEVMPDSVPFYLLYSTVFSGNVVYPITV